MYFQHVYDKSLAQASYFIGCQKAGVALVIDPKRDVDTYVEIARQQKMTITHVAETHIHADFLSGARELAALTGAELYLSDEGGPDWQYEFPHVGLREGDVFRVGNLSLKVMHTPGHTPESISFLLTDHPASDAPVMIFTGDFVFVGDIGRPDLLEKAAGLIGTKDIGARQMLQSIKRFAELPDYLQVWPGHGAGSACGKALGAVPSTTVGYERIRNWALRTTDDAQGFVDYLLADQPEPPRYFAMMKHLNKVERPLVTEVPNVHQYDVQELSAHLAKGHKLIDTRNKFEFAAAHIPGSINIQNNNAIATWAGWFLDYSEPFVVVAQPDQMDDITRKLMRIGLDNLVGFVDNVQDWSAHTGQPLAKAPIVDLEAFLALRTEQPHQLFDLRGISEYNAGHIEGASHLFVGTIEQNLDQVNRDGLVLIHCQGGDRSAIGHSLLLRHGFTNVVNYSAGMNEWTATGQLVVTESQLVDSQ
jgi:hydroxyacylglutathione hydrolase